MRSLFIDYYTATRDTCNTDNRWGPCNAESLFNNYMCAKLRAENYALLVDEGSLYCMSGLQSYLPIFSDIYQYCGLAVSLNSFMGAFAITVLITALF